MRSFWRWENPHPRALWEPEEWATKLTAARIASAAGVDMVIANGADFHIIHKITEGRDYGTLFVGQSREEFYLIDIIDKLL